MSNDYLSYFYRSFFLLFLLSLTACGGDSSAPSNVVENESDVDATSVNIDAKAFAFISPNQDEFVNLAAYLDKGERVVAVSSSTLNLADRELCESSIIQVSDFGFKVNVAGVALCDYQYQVDSSASSPSITKASMSKTSENTSRISTTDQARKMYVVASASNTPLLPITIIMNKNTTQIINIKNHLMENYPADYQLQAGTMLSGSGQVISVDTDATQIEYQSSAEEGGSTALITYTLKGITADGEDDLIIGSVNIAVPDSTRQLPSANNFTYDVNAVILASTPENNSTIDIDVTSAIGFLNSDGELVSQDGVDLQLVDVSSYTADVSLKDPENITNKVFTFSATTHGTHIVNYTIFDHHGGFAMGIIAVNVTGSSYSLWSSRFYKGYLYTAPLTAQEAKDLKVENDGISYKSTYNETSYLPAVAMATFTYSDGKKYCELIEKGRLPTRAELMAFFEELDPSNLNSGDAIAIESPWPYKGQYYLVEYTTMGVTYSYLVDPVSKKGEPYDETKVADGFYVTCMAPMNTYFTTNKDNDGAVADGESTVTLRVLVKDGFGNVAPADETIRVELIDPDSATLVSNAEQAVSSDGNSFEFTSKKAGEVPVAIFYNNDIEIDVIRFIANRDTAYVAEVKVTRNGQPAGEPYPEFYNRINIMILDEFNNPVPNMKVMIGGGNAKASYYAVNPDMATNNQGMLTDFAIGLQRLDDGLVEQTGIVEIQLKEGGDITTVTLTNTFPEIKILNIPDRVGYEFSNGLMTHPIMASDIENNGLFTKDNHEIKELNGISFVLMEHHVAQTYCDNLQRHGYDDWTLPTGTMISSVNLTYGDAISQKSSWPALYENTNSIYWNDKWTGDDKRRYYASCARED